MKGKGEEERGTGEEGWRNELMSKDERKREEREKGRKMGREAPRSCCTIKGKGKKNNKVRSEHIHHVGMYKYIGGLGCMHVWVI
jgi:hypothetical protein